MARRRPVLYEDQVVDLDVEITAAVRWIRDVTKNTCFAERLERAWGEVFPIIATDRKRPKNKGKA